VLLHSRQVLKQNALEVNCDTKGHANDKLLNFSKIQLLRKTNLLTVILLLVINSI